MIAFADAARLGAIRAFVRVFGRSGMTWLVDRERRIAWNGALLVVVAFVATGLVPMWMLAIGPIVWGVPHVLADVRYLVVRPGYHRRVAIAVPAVLGLVAGWAGLGVRAALLAAAAAALLAKGSRVRRGVVATASIGLAAVATLAPHTATVVYAHLHNAVALAFFVLWPLRSDAARGSSWRLVPVLVAAVGALAIAAGALDGAILRALPIGTASFADVVDQLAPPYLVDDANVAIRLTLLYAFGQSVHYVMWLRLVPEEDRVSPRPRSFRQSVRALRADLGLPLLVLGGLGTLALVGYAFADVAAARIRYLELAFFHGWLELVALAVLVAEGKTERR